LGLVPIHPSSYCIEGEGRSPPRIFFLYQIESV
jgi:hypothetical protein